MSCGDQFMAVEFFRVFAGLLEEAHDCAVKQIVVAPPEQEGALHVVGAHAHDMLRGQTRFDTGIKSMLAVAEIHEPLFKVSELRTILLRELARQVGCQEAKRELPLIVVAKVVPVLLNVDLVRIEAEQWNVGLPVTLDQILEKRQSLWAKVIHLRRPVTHHHEHTVQRAEIGVALTTDREPATRRGRTLWFRCFDFYRLPQFDNSFRINVIKVRAPDSLFAEGKHAHTGALKFDDSLVIPPAELLPQRHGEPAGFWIAPVLAILHPAARLAGFPGVARPNFQGREKTQFQSESISPDRLADACQTLDVFLRIRRQHTRLTLLTGAVLFPERVKGEHQDLGAAGARLLANLAQRGDIRRLAEAQIHFLVRVLQILKLLVAHVDDVSPGSLIVRHDHQRIRNGAWRFRAQNGRSGGTERTRHAELGEVLDKFAAIEGIHARARSAGFSLVGFAGFSNCLPPSAMLLFPTSGVGIKANSVVRP